MSDTLISVIVPLCNAEKFAGECLDSILNQTFQDFEVIVVDDGSTDTGRAVVESYGEKFGGRLTLANAEGNNAIDKGLSLAHGEYIQFLNADDLLTKTALEELCALAQNFDADVVACEKFYETTDGTNIQINVESEEISTDKPLFEPEDLSQRIQNTADNRYATMPLTKFIKRNLLTENEIHFSNLADDVKTYDLIFYAKKLLRVPNAVYIRRVAQISALEEIPEQKINSALNSVLLDLKTLDNLMSRNEFFKTNPESRFTLLKNFIDMRFNQTVQYALKLEEHDIYSTIKETFGKKLGEYAVLIPILCAVLYDKKISAPPAATPAKKHESDAAILAKFKRWFSLRLDIQMKTTNREDFQIVSVSDAKADIRKPAWFNKNGVGYVIQSYVGKLNIIFKIVDGGTVTLNLKGLFYPDPEDKRKHIPYWIDCTKFAVNDNVIFNKLTPIWHDKPYSYKFEAKAGEEVTLSVEWLPHRSDT